MKLQYQNNAVFTATQYFAFSYRIQAQAKSQSIEKNPEPASIGCRIIL